MAERRQGPARAPGWRPLLPWWALAVGGAAALKVYFSAAAASGLGWMLHPLAALLHALTGWHFARTAAGEWQSIDAGIVLVQACAGVNYLLLSFLAWCWALAPGGAWRKPADAGTNTDAGTLAQLPWLAAAFAAAWAATLAINAARILAIVRWQPALEHWLAPGDAHRLLGLLVYLPALCLQWLLADRSRPGRGLLLGCSLYVGLMLVLPLATGHAQARAADYLRHAGWALVVLAACALAYTAVRAVRRTLSGRNSGPKCRTAA